MPVSRRWPCTRLFGGCLYLFILWFSLNCFNGFHTQPSRPAPPLKTEGGLRRLSHVTRCKAGLLFARKQRLGNLRQVFFPFKNLTESWILVIFKPTPIPLAQSWSQSPALASEEAGRYSAVVGGRWGTVYRWRRASVAEGRAQPATRPLTDSVRVLAWNFSFKKTRFTQIE